MDWAYWGEWAKLAPIGTAAAAGIGACIAYRAIRAQRHIARGRAAIDFFLKTEMDHQMICAHERYRHAVGVLQKAIDINEFADSKHGQAMRAYLNVHELMAVGIKSKAFDDRVCKEFWIVELGDAREDCNRYLRHLRTDPKEKRTFTELEKLNSRWQRGY
jgi:hypothetical protein